MSSSRLKERGGGGGKVMASRPQRVPPESTPKDKPPPSRRIPTPAATGDGKENPVRWSTSAIIPRGKPSNPPDLSRILPRVSSSMEAGIRRSVGGGGGGGGSRLLRKDPKLTGGSRVSEDRGRKFVGKDAPFSNLRGDGKLLNGIRVLETRKLKALEVNSEGNGRKGPTCGKVDAKDEPFDPKMRSKQSATGNVTVEICKDKAYLVSKSDAGVLVKSKEKECSISCDASKLIINSCSGSVNVGLDREKDLDCIRVFENRKEHKVDNEGDVRVSNKYPSKLHEKLAHLEGRVQRIASDIRRTKEMLEQNNQDGSKLILSDIQKKISGIEKAVECVADGSSLEPMREDSLQNRQVVGGQPRQASQLKSSVKGLKLEELEARFFPHQKLIKNRTSSTGPSKQDRCSQMDLSTRQNCPQKENGSLSPIDENSIALEFLASLDTKQSEMNKDGFGSELAAVREMVMESTANSRAGVSKKAIGGHSNEVIALKADEKFEDFDDWENKPAMMLCEEIEDSGSDQMSEIGYKASTGGWFVSEGEAVLLAHNDGSCSYYDIANSEEKAEYMPPQGTPNNLWGDCWLIRAPGADGCSGRYVVAASAGNTLDSGFCSWDFYTKKIQASRVEDEVPTSFSISSSRTALAPITNMGFLRSSTSCATSTMDRRQWWYRPCGPLLISTASRQKSVSAFDIRDGDLVMKWEVNSPVSGMEYSSPLQWRSRGKVIIAETEAISLWDVNSQNANSLLSVASGGKKVYSLHVHNTDAEVGGGIRQRVRSSEVEGNDGVVCTQESINVFDFRLPSGVGLRISRHGTNGHSIFSCGDSIFIGSTDAKLRPRSSVQHFSLRKGKLMATYALPDSDSHSHHSSITQVWGNSNLVMGICGMGLFVFDTWGDDSAVQSFGGNTVEVKEIIGPDDLYHPTFDYLGSRVLVISRDRPASWRYL